MDWLSLSLGAVIDRISESLKRAVSNKRKPQVTDVQFGFVLPRRTVINRHLSYEYATNLGHDEAFSHVKCQNDWNYDWINSVELAFNITNNAASKSIAIVGFHLDTEELPNAHRASYLEIPQGDSYSSDLLRFVTSLEMRKENGGLSFQRYHVEDGQLHFIEDPDYFSLRAIPLRPGNTKSVNLSIVSNKKARIINRAYVIYSINNRRHMVEIPLILPIRVFPLHLIDEDQRYTYTYRGEPPILRLEKDPAYPNDICMPGRWDDYPPSYHAKP